MYVSESVEVTQSCRGTICQRISKPLTYLLPSNTNSSSERFKFSSMAKLMSTLNIEMIDTIDALGAMLDTFDTIPRKQPSFFIDLQGENLGRHGALHILSLYFHPKHATYLVNVTALASLAFSTTNSSKTSIKSILESTELIKVVFDVRNQSDVLFNDYQVSINGVQDVQLMELASRKGSKEFLTSFSKCIEQQCSSSERTKHKAFDIKNEADTMASERSMHRQPTEYRHGKVSRQLPQLYQAYSSLLESHDQKFWRVEVEGATKARIELSRNPKHQPNPDENTRGPWSEAYIEQAIDNWNEDVLFEAMWEDEDPERDAWNEEVMWEAMHGDYDYMSDYDDHNPFPDTARDCIGWEEDMIKNGSPF